MGRLLGTVLIVGATIFGIGAAAFRTSPGRVVLTRFGGAILEGAVHGTAEVGSVGGSFLEGLVIEDVTLRDEQGDLLARLPRIVVRYRLRDLLSGRIVLGQVVVSDPEVQILQRPNGRFNYQEVLGLGGEGEGGIPPLIAFNDAELRNANLVIRTPSEAPRPDEDFAVEQIEQGQVRVRHVRDLNADVAYVRLSSPFPGENGIRFDIDRLRADLDDPKLPILDLNGRIEIDGDSLEMDLERLELPGSQLQVQGSVKWPDDGLQVNLAIDADRIRVDDLGAFATQLPWGMSGNGRLTVRSLTPDSLAIDFDPMRLVTPSGGGSASGRLGVVVSRGEVVTFDRTRISFTDLDLDYFRPMLDTIPLDGRLTGVMSANGPSNLLDASVDWSFSDARLLGGPTSYVRGSGFLALGGDGLTFLSFDVDSARFDLGTVRLLFPAVDLQGQLWGAGVLSGFWLNTEFSGALWHRDGDHPFNRVSGSLRFDSRGDTLGVYADLSLDSLYLAGIQPSYPMAPPEGVVAGRFSTSGRVDSLPFSLDVIGPGGQVVASGYFVFLPDRVAVFALDANVAGLDASHFYPGILSTELSGRVTGEAVADTGQATRTDLVVDLGFSRVAQAPLDSVRGRLGLADSLLNTDLRVWSQRLRGEMSGNLGLTASRQGTLNATVNADSLGTVRPLIDDLYGVLAAESLTTNLTGTGRATLSVTGSVADYDVTLAAIVPSAVTDSAIVRQLVVDARWSSSLDRESQIHASVDSVGVRWLAFSDLEFRLDGSRRIGDWFARARLGLDGSWIGWGKVYADEQVVVMPFDTMAVLLPSHVWQLDHSAIVSSSDSGFLFSNFALVSRDRGARLALDGLFPTNGSANLTASLVAIPVKDVWGLMQKDPTEVDGLVSGSITLGGTAPEPEARAMLSMEGGRVGSVRIPYMTGTLDYRDRTLVGSYDVTRGGDLITELDLRLPLDLALRSVPERRVDGPLSITARATDVDLAFVELFARNVSNAGGSFSANVGVEGTWEHPVLTGSASIVGGTATFAQLGIVHRDLVAGVHLTGDSIVIDSLRLNSGPGSATASGLVRLEGLRQPRLDLRLDGREFHLVDITGFLALTTTGTVELRGPVFGATLTGQGTITDGVLYFADLIEKNVVNLEDSLYAELIGPDLRALIQREGLGADFENRFLDSLRIDNLRLDMGQSVWLRSTQANVRLAGRLNVNKVADQYRYDGTLNTPLGSYRLPLVGGSKDFRVTDGEVRYFGTTDLNADLNINAEHVVRTVSGDNLRVYVNVGGTLQTPEVTLTTDREPPLPTSEIISYLLVGAPSVEAIGAGNDIQRSIAMSAFSGEVASQLERTLITDLGVPIDYIRIAPEGLRGAGFSFGRRVGERFFVIYSPLICPTESFSAGRFGYGRVEFRFADEWRWSFSRAPVATCSATSRFSDRVDYQLGFDLVWERRY